MINNLCFNKSETPLTHYQKTVLATSAIVSLAIAVISALVLSSLYIPGLNSVSQVFSFMATVEGGSIGIALGVILCGISLLPVFRRACGHLPQSRSPIQQNDDALNNEAVPPNNPEPVPGVVPRVLSRREILEGLALGFPERSIFRYPPSKISPLEEVSDIILNIASFLHGSDILSLQSVSKRFCNALGQKHFWTRLQARYGLQLSEDLDPKVIKACVLMRCGAAFKRVVRRVVPSDANDSDSKAMILCDFISTKGMHVYKDGAIVFKSAKTLESISIFSKDGIPSYPFQGEKLDYFHPLNHELVLVSKKGHASEIRSLSGGLPIKLQDPDNLLSYLFCSTIDKLIGLSFAESSKVDVRNRTVDVSASLKIWNFDGSLSQAHEIVLPRDMQFSSMVADKDRIILISKGGDIIRLDLRYLPVQTVHVTKSPPNTASLEVENYGGRGLTDLDIREKYTCAVIWKQYLLAGSNDGAIYVWNLDTNTYHRSLAPHFRCVTCLSLRGDTLVSGSRDGTVKIWDLATMNYCGTILSGKGPIECLGIFENTVWISNDDGISFFDFTPKELL